MGGEVFYESILESSDLAENPGLLVDAIEAVMPLDLIAAPSGYGVKVSYLKDLVLESLERWYLKYILLLKKKDSETAVEEGNPGVMVYSAMTGEELVERFIEKREKHEKAWNQIMEDVEKTISSLSVSISNPKEVLISG
ncbi:hypothetical protein AKJ65_03780 [candidate division MSBL1 archaeon SCGC-AAA259E19]|uniref:Uncharacterized protein n=2 Tax=candidate division MSBL1 TaxID=215777 RepID=A0A133UGM6_9EURY|nr:hypothetical protein AKJ64_00940 [candidate division MSBL1 archaeon SCGC-AAA259E17]KXA94671.1 hypothetical protein AKJ65_03780 [candidate division MSBL1 archaeon SCGC-AAA259E19]